MKLFTNYTGRRALTIASLLISIISSNFAQSVQKDLVTGLTTRGKGLSYDGMEGYSVNAGQVQLGLNLVLKDANGSVILDEADLFGDDPLKYEDVHLQVASNFILTGTKVVNPVNFSVRIWDKNSPSWISASTALVIE